jgi:hypothetical protein
VRPLGLLAVACINLLLMYYYERNGDEVLADFFRSGAIVVAGVFLWFMLRDTRRK